MESLLEAGKVRNIGVSNFAPYQLKDLIDKSTIKPAVHQFETHPYLQQLDFVEWHHDNGISITAYSPLANANPIYSSPGRDIEAPPALTENKDISDIALGRGCTNVQVALSWGMHRGTSVIPKSQHADRIEENYGAMGCELQEADNDAIEKIGVKYSKRFNNPGKSWGVPLYEGLEDSG